MSEEKLPSANELRQRTALYVWSGTAASCLVMALYLSLLSDIQASDWAAYWAAALGMSVIAAGLSVFLLRRTVEPIERWLDSQQDGLAEPSKMIDAFKAAAALPSDAQRTFTAVHSVAAILTGAALVLAGDAGWSLGMRTMALLAGGVTAAMACGATLFYALKRDLEWVRATIAMQIPDPKQRRSCIRPISITRKIATGMVATVASVLVFAMALAHDRTQAALDETALTWQVKILRALVEDLGTMELEAASSSLTGASSLWPYPVTFVEIDPETGYAEGKLPANIGEEVVALVTAGVTAGTLQENVQDALWAFRTNSQGRLIAASIARSDVYAQASSMFPVFVALLILSTSCALFVALMIGRDLREAIHYLREATETASRGDLRPRPIHDSEDEVGELWHSFEVMEDLFRSTVHSLVDAASRVDSTADQISQVAEGVSEASEDQVRGIQQASDLMVSINRQVTEIADSAQNLNISVEESSSSILELGAAGDELNETASVLGDKVEEVSSSIEQMVRSVKQVSSSSDGLADAAAETSASMEEMASAMRAVDTTAELTAELSRNVVGSAESGQDKVSQTIDGMQAIQDATDTAEKVIRGLGARTQEIGAILDVIDDVAEETNLLALNAAIIAAQAGEHGRAFSVVADEIKELADRVLASTKEIGGLIKAVQDESDNAVGAIEVGSRSVASGVELSAEAGLSLEEITRSARESGQRIGEIVSAVREQTKAASHVVALMDTVRDGVTAIVGASADQDRGNEVVYRSSVTMREVTQQVRRTTEEQSRGFRRIRESIEGVREVVENIDASLQEQSTTCNQVTEFLSQVFERTRSNEDAAKSMGDSIRGLTAEADALRAQVQKFQI
jgi:methyl-accepting chemotaxis protein